MSKITVLVVEDEVLIRMCAAQTIEDAGYDVLEAADADSAIDILEEHQDVRVVFTDINMPGSMDGLGLMRAIHNRWPSIRVIVTSGKVYLKDGDISADDRFIAKPYAPEKVESILHDLAS